MKKTGKQTTGNSADKGFLETAGQVIGHLGHEMVEVKDHLVEAAVNKFTAVRKTIKKKLAGKKSPAPAKKKKAAPKKILKKTGSVKGAKKTAKKAVVSVKRRVAAAKPKKTAKKSAPARKKR